MSSTQELLAKYPLGDDTAERERLVAQYIATKKVFGWTSPLPLSVDLNSLTNVLDMAAGTCVWMLDLANSNVIKDRLASGKIALHACDLTLTKFPSKDVLNKLGIRAFQQDVTKPFPQEMHGKFDLVHLSLVVLALSPEDWDKALENCRVLLKPGGPLWSIENDPALSSVIENGHDLDANMDGTSWHQKYNCAYTGTVLKNGTFTDLSFRMETLLKSHSFTVISSQKCVAPFGKACEAYPALRDEVANTAHNCDMLYTVMAQGLFKKGALEGPKGTKITTEEELQALVEEMRRGVREDGAYIVLFEYIAIKEA